MLSFLLTLALALAPAVQVDLATPRERVQAAYAVLESGQAAEADRLFRDILTDYPTAMDAYRGLALAYVRQGRTNDAGRMLTSTASLMQQAGLGRQFRPLLELAVEIAPGSAAAHYFLGSALSEEGSHRSAAEHFQAALDLGDTQVATRVALAAALWESGELEQSETHFRAALVASNRHPIALHQYATLLLFEGRYEEARDLMTEVASATPPTVYVLLDLARALQGTGQIEAALEATRTAVAMQPDLLRAHFALATLLARAGDRAAAAAASEEYRRLATAAEREMREASRMQASVEEAQSLWLREEYDRVLATLDGLPATVEVLELRAAAHASLGDHAMAAQALEEALGIEPGRRELQAWLERERAAQVPR